jgi:GGDEF domain-containing protein
MITLSTFLARGPKDGASGARHAEALNRIVSVLLQGIALHSFNFDAERFVTFGSAVRKVRAEFENASDEATALLAAGAAIRLLEEHSQAAEIHTRSRQRDMEAITAMLSETLLQVSGASQETMVRLKQIERDIAASFSAEEIGVARAKLAGCLAEMRTTAFAESREPRPPNWPSGENDPVTGLPDARSAAIAINSIWDRRDAYYAALLTLERLDTINLRFGVRAGDQIFLLMSQRIAQALGNGDMLFRWRGPCLLLLLPRQAPESHVAAEVSRLATTRTENSMAFRDREVIVPISIAWNLVPLAGLETLEDLMRQTGEFPGNRSRGGRRVLAAAM